MRGGPCGCGVTGGDELACGRGRVGGWEQLAAEAAELATRLVQPPSQ